MGKIQIDGASRLKQSRIERAMLEKEEKQLRGVRKSESVRSIEKAKMHIENVRSHEAIFPVVEKVSGRKSNHLSYFTLSMPQKRAACGRAWCLDAAGPPAPHRHRTLVAG